MDTPRGNASLWIVVLNYNGADDTMRCLESLQPSLERGASVIVVDNASLEDPGASIAQAYPGVHYLRNSENLGYAGGNNAGIKFALSRGAHWICLLNNDTRVSPRFSVTLLQEAAAAESFGAIGPLIMAMAEPDVVMTDGCEFNRGTGAGFFARKEIPLGASLADVDIVNGCCLLLSAAALKVVGLIDERFFLVHEESDLCLRIQAAGFRCGVFGAPLVWHKGSSSFRRTGNGLQRYFDSRNIWLLLAKHPRRRNRWASRRDYFKYVFYRYSLELEDGHLQSAEAVLEGVYDALVGRFGPRISHRRPFLVMLRVVFDAGRLYTGLKRAVE